ncbi:MAG TPA: S8 family serine peptidase [Thermoanaerobaculia bacterium]|nr:S8 family serine peptidase [Thermoanaerobaculia bacterium]
MSDEAPGSHSDETGYSLILTRQPDYNHDLLRQHVSPDIPPFPDENTIILPDGRIIIRTRAEKYLLEARLSASLGAEFRENYVVELDRRLYRIPPDKDTSLVTSPSETMTWGLDAIGISNSTRSTGEGAIVAVLDTGLAFDHPDFCGRIPPTNIGLFYDKSAYDSTGHGTHCAGTIAGRTHSKDVPRYGVAPDATLLIGNIFDGGQCSDWNLLKGMVWANYLGAHVISMSVGDRPRPKYSVIFQIVAEVLCAFDTIIVAAAGNESDRQYGYVGPIVHPADCPAIVAVAAVTRQDEKFRPSRASSGGVSCQRMPTLAAPGVGVFSSFLTSFNSTDGKGYRRLSGTSQAAPHVAGVAALLYSQYGYKGQKLIEQLTADVDPIPEYTARDVGCGLVRVPK